MRLLNEEKNDFSTDAYVVMATMLWSLRAAERLGSRMADAIQAMGWRRTFFQEKKRHYTEAKRACEAMINHLELATGETMTKLYDKAAANGETRYLGIVSQDMTDAAACLLLMYFAKSNNDAVAATSMLKAISNFKNKDPEIHLNELLEWFHYNHLIR